MASAACIGFVQMKKAYYILYVLRRWWSADLNQKWASIRLSCQSALTDGLSKTKPGMHVDHFYRKLSQLLIIQAFELIFSQKDYRQAMGTPTPTQGMSCFVQLIHNHN